VRAKHQLRVDFVSFEVLARFGQLSQDGRTDKWCAKKSSQLVTNIDKDKDVNLTAVLKNLKANRVEKKQTLPQSGMSGVPKSHKNRLTN
jgi:hypothetical protein